MVAPAYDRRDLDASKVFAAVELGSNSFHLVVARTVRGHVQVVDRMRERIRLGLAVDDDGHVEGELRDRALACLRRFGERISSIDPSHVRAVGTHALRRADGDFLEDVRRALGCEVDVLDGIAEAHLVNRGVGVGVGESRPGADRFVLDIGGGSTECVHDRSGSVVSAVSVDVGCVSATGRFFEGGLVTKRGFRKAIQWAEREFRGVVDEFEGDALDDCEALGSSGTINAIQRVLRSEGIDEHAVRAGGLERLRKRLVNAREVSESGLRGVDGERLGVLPGGVAVLIGAFEAFGLESMNAVSSGLRDGLVDELRERVHQKDEDLHEVQRIAERFHVDAAHAERVHATVCAMFEQVRDDLSVDPEIALRVLAAAARLHEVGLSVSHSGHHRHAEYLLHHCRLPGFAAADRECIAALVRYHRRKLSGASFPEHGQLGERTQRRLCAILRLAVILNRSRGPHEFDALRLQANKGGFALRLSKRMRTAMLVRDLEAEMGCLESAGLELDVRWGS